MSEEKKEKTRFGIPKYYYWAKSPPRPSHYQATRFVNVEQRKFYWATLAFTVAKVVAIITVFLLMLGAL
jgi:hypothetical protein